MKTILCLSPTIIKQLPITYLVNKYLNKNDELEPRMINKMPYNPYLINRLKRDYYNKLKKNNPIMKNTEF
jgi:hypothetical protein